LSLTSCSPASGAELHEVNDNPSVLH